MWSRGRGRGRGRGGGRGRGRGGASGRGGGSRFSSFSSKLVDQRADSDTSSLSDLSLSALDSVDLSKESTFMKRLFKEYVEIRNNPLQGISVAPLSQDFTKWHGNLAGPQGTPYEGGVFHFSISFASDHPRSPPTVMMLSRIEHPCVTNGRVGLDFLQVYSEQQQRGGRAREGPPKNTQRYRMWSPAYTATSILIQLQAFLFEGTAEIALQNLTNLSEYTERKSKWESGVKFSVVQSLNFSCSSCRHRLGSYWPTLEEHVDQPVVSMESVYLENAVCVFTRKSCEEAALGIGISFTKDLRTGRIQTVRCVPDIISLNAFKNSGVTELWGQGFTHWIPIYLHGSHPERSLYLARRSLSSMYSGNPHEFEDSMVMDFFPRLLCHLAVSFVNADEGGDALRALAAYCYMHRLFLQFVKESSSLVASARQTVKEFIQDEAKRHMEHTPAIGHIVILASFTGVLWAELAPPYLSEGFDRQVRRIIQRHPELSTSEPDAKIDATRITKSFQATNLSGLRFLMTQLMFNRLFVCPEGSSLDYVISQYDKHSSLLPKRLEDKLLEEKKSIMAVSSFSGFLECVGEKVPSEEELLVTLRNAVANSARKRYHGDKGIEVLSPEEFEKQRLGAIKPLGELVEAAHLHGNEEQWKSLCETRFGLTELPCSYGESVSDPWKHLYLQHNLQELVSKLNDNPDFQLLYKTLELSKDTLTHFDLVTFTPDNIKSHYYFLSRILELLPLLTHLTISKGEIGFGEKGFKELVKGMTKSSGALQVLDIRYLGIKETHVSKLAESHLTSDGLRCLHLEGNALCSEGTVKLSQLMLKHRSLPNLAELNLKACQITDEGMKALAEGLLVKRNIRKLDLSKNRCGYVGLAEVIQSLSYSSTIEELLLTDISLIHGGSAHLSTLSKSLAKLFQLTVSLKKVSFWHTALVPAFDKNNLKHLAANTTITDFDLGSTQLSVTDANEAFGAAFTHTTSLLDDLDLSDNKLTCDGCTRLNKQTKGKTSPVTTLNLSKNSALFTSRTSSDKEKIAKEMTFFFSHTFGKVTKLDVSKCSLDSDAAEVFGTVLSKNTALKELDLRFNSLGKHGARFLANGMATNTNLDVLKLDKNRLGAAGAHYLATVIAEPSCTLKELHLFCNYIDVPGTTAICKALETNKHLQYIDLGMNRVRKRGAAAVISMLTINTSLKMLCLKFNYIPDSWAIKLVKQLVEVPSCHVTTLKLAGNTLQHDTLVTIVTTLKEAACEVDFDLSARAEYRIPERMERTVYVSPLAANITPEMVKRMFYSKKCGAIKSVKIEKHRKKKAAFAKANYALVEFAHKDSVELAVDLVRKREAHIGAGYQPIISRAGLTANAAAQAAAKSVKEPTGLYSW